MENNTCTKCGAVSQGMVCQYCGAEMPQAAVQQQQQQQQPSQRNIFEYIFGSGHSADGHVENLSLWGYFVKCLKNYANFKGRARRKEFWGFFLFYNLTWFFPSVFLGVFLGLDSLDFLAFFGILHSLSLLIPFTAVVVRRIKDVKDVGIDLSFFTNAAKLSPLLMSIMLNYLDVFSSPKLWLPCGISIVCLMYYAFKDSEPGENKHGANPKGVNISDNTQQA